MYLLACSDTCNPIRQACYTHRRQCDTLLVCCSERRAANHPGAPHAGCSLHGCLPIIPRGSTCRMFAARVLADCTQGLHMQDVYCKGACRLCPHNPAAHATRVMSSCWWISDNVYLHPQRRLEVLSICWLWTNPCAEMQWLACLPLSHAHLLTTLVVCVSMELCYAACTLVSGRKGAQPKH